MELTPYNDVNKEEVHELFIEVFSQSEGPSEGALIGDLVLNMINDTNQNELVGFIASEQETIIGCIFFTRLSFDSPIDAFILSPVAIHSGHQGQGVGQKLINHGIKQLQEKEVNLVFTYGDPAFYSRVGFQCISEDVAKAPQKLTQPEGWLCQSLDCDIIPPLSGRARCVSALNKPEYW